MRSKKVTAKDLAKEATLKLVQKISESVDDFVTGNSMSSITASEAKFLQDVIKLEQEEAQGEAVVAYLQHMDMDELEKYHEKLKQSLEEGESLN